MRDLTTDFAKACTALDAAVLDLLSGGWDEAPRRQAHDLAVALRQAARGAGWRDSESDLRAVESLLALSSREVQPVRRAVGDRLLEFLGELRKSRLSRTA